MRTAGWIPRASSRSSSSACVSSSRAPRGAPPPRPGRPLSFDSTSAERDRERDEPLLGAVVQVALERAARAILGANEASARGAKVLGDPLALGDVDARDEQEPALVDLGQRCARPRDRQLVAVARQPRVVVLSRRHRRRRRSRRAPRPRRPRPGRRSPPRALAPDLLRLVPEGAARTRCCAALREPTFAVDQAQHARRVVRDRVQERTLALLLDLEPPAFRHLDAGDENERIGAPCDVRDGHGRPRERAEAPVRAAQLGLDLVRDAPRGRRRDRGDGAAVVVLARSVEEGVPDELVVAPAESLPNARFAPTRGLSTSDHGSSLRSSMTAMLGIDSSAVVVASRSRSSSSSRFGAR